MRRFLIPVCATALLLTVGCNGPSGAESPAAGGDRATGSAQDLGSPGAPAGGAASTGGSSSASGHGGSSAGSGGGSGSAAGSDGSSTAGQKDGAIAGAGQSGEASSAADSRWLPEPAGGLKAIVVQAPAATFQHHQIKAGQPIDRNGIFFMKTATGDVEGWTLGAAPNRWPRYGASADNRWVSAWEQERVYLLDRKSGSAYQWAYNGAELLAVQGDSLLFRTGSRFWVSGDGLGHAAPIPLKPEERAQAVMAADGRAAILVNGDRVYLLDIRSAGLREVGRIPANYAAASLATLRHGEEVVVGLYLTDGARGVNDHRIQRYDWTGRQLADQSTPGYLLFSPDGRLAAWSGQVLEFVDELVVGSGSEFVPRFRLLGVNRCPEGAPGGDPWLADSSAIVVRTREGFRLLRQDGSLAALALGDLGFWEAPVPAPDRADWFAVGGVKVMDPSGKPVVAAIPYADGHLPGNTGISPWGDESDELRFVLGVGGKDYGCLGPILPPQVEPAPFSAIAGMEVAVAEGDCVNLRQSYDRTAPVLACLPKGTRLTGATPPGRLNKGYLERVGTLVVNNMGGEGWWFVQTETGRRGWVLLSGDYLRLAAARSGDPAPDPVSDLVRDESANMLYWLGASAGGVSGSDGGSGSGTGGGTGAFQSESVWALAEWCRQSGPGYIRRVPGFDPARHNAGVTTLETGCKVLQSAWATLGDPTDTPAWREQVAGVKAILTGRP